jgi:hypothetical protein
MTTHWRWRFSDGTAVALDGTIEGTSAFAERLRYDVMLISLDQAPQVFVGPPPCEPVPLELGNARVVDQWLMSARYRARVDVLESPYPMPGPQPVRPPNPDEPQTVY